MAKRRIGMSYPDRPGNDWTFLGVRQVVTQELIDSHGYHYGNWERDCDPPKPITLELQQLLASREALGLQKYGVTVENRTDLLPSKWCQHAIEEALDLAVYLMKMKRDAEARETSDA